MTALTANNPALQPGFEHADTSVTAAVCLSGYHVRLESASTVPSSPTSCIGPDAPAIFIAHGDHDTAIPTVAAEDFANQLRAISTNPGRLRAATGLPAQLRPFHSFRFEGVIDGIETFTTWLRQHQDRPKPIQRHGSKGTERARVLAHPHSPVERRRGYAELTDVSRPNASALRPDQLRPLCDVSWFG